MKILAKDYLNRKDLETFIHAEVGTDRQENKLNTIEGTREELQQLFLSDTSNVFGIKCVITDTPTKTVLINKKKNAKATRNRIR